MESGEHFEGRAFEREGKTCAKAHRQETETWIVEI